MADTATEDIAPLLEAGVVRRLEDADEATKALEARFRVAGGQLQWSSNERRRLSAPPARLAGANHPGTSFDTAEWAQDVVRFVESLELEPTTVLVALDLPILQVLELHLRDLPALLLRVHDAPCHKYIFPPRAQWCIHWTFGDDVVYGVAESG